MSSERFWPFPKFHPTPLRWQVSSKFVIGMVGLASKFWTGWLNRTTVHNIDKLHALVDRRTKKPLLTISNHTSCLDDPLLWGLLKTRILTTNNETMRWNLAAAELCFSNAFTSNFFALGRCVPVYRGEGVYQRAVDFVIQQLNNGGWAHIFPEGKVNMNNELLRLKWGVGRLIAECKSVPIILPMWHCGMDDVLPNKSPYIPRIGKKITVLVGEPLELHGLVESLKKSKLNPMDLRKAITDVVQEHLQSLKPKAEFLHNQTR